MVIVAAVLFWSNSAARQGIQSGTPKPIPFSQDIAAFKQADKVSPPSKGQILFIGSSSFTRWTDVGSYFPDRKILNRAFGGSSLPDVIRFVDDVVTPYAPKQVVIYCGENDFAGNPKLASYVVLNRFKHLFRAIRHRFPEVPIAYIAMKPSPSRWYMRAKFVAANQWISAYLRQQRGTAFIDVWNAMLDEHGRPKPSIFVGDQLHMNASGYKIWQPIFDSMLVKSSP